MSDHLVPPALSAEAETRAVLEEFLSQSGALWAAVVDRSGLRLCEAGHSPAGDNNILCALAAGAVAATRELAQRLGSEEFREQVHEGADRHLVLASIDADHLLLIVFSSATPMGLIRYYARKWRPALVARVARLAQESLLEPGQMPAEFRQYTGPLIGGVGN